MTVGPAALASLHAGRPRRRRRGPHRLAGLGRRYLDEGSCDDTYDLVLQPERAQSLAS
ncbi:MULTISPECIES: hypothetical protein [unclassified Streptomyces]|uniref:hypothetical protein n=1 Tax=unclassified Streptomyces TaxID=2593676 RepID=UPI002E23AD5E|nr:MULTISPECIES: hypothetical protein [unclassified Streptomyces]